MRPPYGDQSLASHLAARRLGLTVVAWSVVGADWADDDGPAIAARVLAGLHPGAIVLLHDSLASFAEERHRDRGAMLAAVEAVLVARPDWRFVTVPELLALGRPRRRWWIQRDRPRLSRRPAVPPGYSRPERSRFRVRNVIRRRGPGAEVSDRRGRAAAGRPRRGASR